MTAAVLPKICFVVGDNRTAHCGVKDYAQRLAESLVELGSDAGMMAPASWSARDCLRMLKELQQRHVDIIHLQYPSIGQRRSLWPHLLGQMMPRTKLVVTLHEYSALPLMQRMSTHLFRWSASEVVFTEEREKRLFGPTTRSAPIVPIGSNVPCAHPVEEFDNTVLYFGQIRPEKGLEEFIALATDGKRKGKPFRFRIIGSVPERRTDYYQALRAKSGDAVEWSLDMPFAEVAHTMSASLAAYLPYPDGASYRRGSLLAALANGMPVLTTLGPSTPEELLPVIAPTTGHLQALEKLEQIQTHETRVLDLRQAARSFAERFSWRSIAEMHLRIYNDLLRAPDLAATSVSAPVQEAVGTGLGGFAAGETRG